MAMDLRAFNTGGRSIKHACLIVLVAGCATCTASSVAAQDPVEQAAALDREARKAFEQEDFAQAAKKFADAYRVVPHPATLYNEAMAWDRGGQLARAADAYRRVLDEKGLDDARAQAAKDRLGALEHDLAVLRIQEPAGAKASVAHVQDALVPCVIHLTPGSHVVTVIRPNGETTRRTVEARAGQDVEFLIEVAPPAPPEPQPPQPPAPVEPAEEDGTTATWGWVALGSAVAFSGAATYLGVQTLGARDDFESSDRLNADDRDRALRYRTWTNVAWGAAAVTGTVGVVLLLSSGEGKRDEAPSTASVRLTPTGAQAAWTF